jgi:competence protein ComEA
MLAADLGAPAAEKDEPRTQGASGSDQWWADHTRVVPQPAEDTLPGPTAAPSPAPAAETTVPALPRPGRHAARRPRRMPAVVPGLGAAHLAVIAVAVAVALAGTTWWLLRDRAEPVAPAPTAMPTDAAPLVTASSDVETATSTADEDRVTVDVAGKVRRPGIVVLATGARVVDALEAAGGPRKGVDTSGINLARVLVDGEQIVVGTRAAAPAPPGAASGAPGGSATPVNLNLADQAELETLPQVGPVTAAAIIAWRDEHGGFSSVDQLVEVDGIGEKTLEQIAPHATV